MTSIGEPKRERVIQPDRVIVPPLRQPKREPSAPLPERKPVKVPA